MSALWTAQAEAIFSSGVQAIAANGVLGDPTQASAAHGERYWEKALSVTLDALGVA